MRAAAGCLLRRARQPQRGEDFAAALKRELTAAAAAKLDASFAASPATPARLRAPDSKLTQAVQRYLFTEFGYGCNVRLNQTARYAPENLQAGAERARETG